MLFLTRYFGVTGSDAERNLAQEESVHAQIVEKVLLMQAKSAAQQHRPLRRGTHAKGVCARAQFEVFDVAAGSDPVLAARLAKGIFATPGVYPAVVRFGNSDPKVNSDFKPDVRSLSFSVDLTRRERLFLRRTLADKIFQCKTQRRRWQYQSCPLAQQRQPAERHAWRRLNTYEIADRNSLSPLTE